MAVAGKAQQRLERRIVDAALGRNVQHVVDDDRHLGGDVAQCAGDLGQDAPLAPHLHHPVQRAHRRPECLEHVEADAAHVAGAAGGREQVEAQPAHAAAVPIRQRVGGDARVRDGDAAQPIGPARERIEHDAVVVAVRVALHHDAMREAEVVEQRDVVFRRRRRWRVAAPLREGKFLRRPEHVGMRIPRAGQEALRGPARMRHRPGDERRIVLRNGGLTRA